MLNRLSIFPKIQLLIILFILLTSHVFSHDDRMWDLTKAFEYNYGQKTDTPEGTIWLDKDGKESPWQWGHNKKELTRKKVWIRARLPEKEINNKSLLILKRYFLVCSIYIGDELIRNVGTGDEEDGYQLGPKGMSPIIDVTSISPEGKYIYFELFSYRPEFLAQALYWGDAEELAVHLIRDDLPYFANTLWCTLFGIFCLLIYFFLIKSRLIRIYAFFNFTIGSVSFLLTTLGIFSLYPLVPGQPSIIWHLAYSIIMLTPLGVGPFAVYLFGDPKRKIARFYHFFYPAYALLSFFHMQFFTSAYKTVFVGFFLFSIPYINHTLLLAIKAARQGNRHARFFVAGQVVMLVGFAWDMSVVLFGTQPSYITFKVGLFLFNVFLGLTIGSRFKELWEIAKNNEEKLSVTNRELIELNEIKEKFFNEKKIESIGVLAGGIAHDFNNVMSGITANTALAKMLNTEKENCGEQLDNIEKACIRATGLTNQLLTFSRGGEPVRSSVALDQLVDEAVNFALTGSKVAAKIELGNGPYNADIDRGQIEQVLHNLTINAIQAMPEGGHIEISVNRMPLTNHNVLPEGDYLKIFFKDKGKGIDPATLDKIFDPYFSTKSKGHGLGLAICHSIIKKHGGYIKAASSPGKGTIFVIYLPAAAAESREEPDIETPSATYSGRILLLDDEEVILESLSSLLHHMGLTVDICRNGIEAVDLYKKKKAQGKAYDLGIFDIIIPGNMGGQEALKEILAWDPDARIIATTGYASSDIMSNFRHYGFADILLKPVEIKKLRQILSRLLKAA